MTWQGRWALWGRHFIEMLHRYVFCSICNALYPPYRFFQHDSFVSNGEACEMYISWLFLYTSATWEAYICLDIHIFTSFFVFICFLQIVGEVIWHSRPCPLPHWEVFHWYGPKIIFCNVYTSVSPPKHFFNIMNLVGIASHIACTFLSDYSINVHVCMLIFVYILIFLHIFVWECLA